MIKIKIIHFSDTHISHKRTKNIKDSWKIQGRTTWIEDDHNRAFSEAIDIAIESDCDYLVHSGDLFDIPVKNNLSSPSEATRAFVIEEFHRFFEGTNNRAPIIIIDGNHGTFLTRNHSTLEVIAAAFPKKVYLATNYDLKKAITQKKPLKVEFDEINFYLFPYFDFSSRKAVKQRYEEWVQNYQQPDDSKMNVAIAHGMTKGIDLSEYLFQFNYDYVALGHNHLQAREAENMWQAGSTQRYTFTERNYLLGVLEVELHKSVKPIIRPRNIRSLRDMAQYEIVLNEKYSLIDLEKEVERILLKYKKPFEGETATRLKLTFTGQALVNQWWRMEDYLLEFQSKALSNDYNLLEFRWDHSNLSKISPMSLQKGAKIHEYLIEDPIKDFEKYLRNIDFGEEESLQEYLEQGVKLIEEAFSADGDGTLKEEFEE